MGRQSLINTADDMRWLRKVHLPQLPAKYKSALIVGNEDYPERIEVYERRNPLVTDVPVIFEADEEDVFKEKSSSTRHHSTKKAPVNATTSYRAIVAGKGILIGGIKRHVSSWFPTKWEADDWAWAISTTNQAARRPVAYVTIEKRHGNVIETVKWAHAGEVAL